MKVPITFAQSEVLHDLPTARRGKEEVAQPRHSMCSVSSVAVTRFFTSSDEHHKFVVPCILPGPIVINSLGMIIIVVHDLLNQCTYF